MNAILVVEHSIYFAEQECKNKEDVKSVIEWRCNHDKCTEMYGKNGYKDDRKVDDIMKFLNLLNNLLPEKKELLNLWYSLALSDPGQILKESPVILVEKGEEKAQIYTYSSISKTESSMISNTVGNVADSISFNSPEDIRSCKALEEIRKDVAKRLSNLREEKR